MHRICHVRLPLATKSFIRHSVSLLPRLNFMTIHYLYFIITISTLSIIFWACSRPEQSIDYVDCLFVVTSALTETGLNTINLSELNTVQQTVLFLEMICGSTIFVSFFVVLFRKRAFESRLAKFIETRKVERQERCRRLPELFNGQPHGTGWGNPNEQLIETGILGPMLLPQLFVDSQAPCKASPKTRHSKLHIVQRGNLETTRSEGYHSSICKCGTIFGLVMSKSSSTNSSDAYELSREERERLGGSEYGAVELLTYLVPAYLLAWQLLGCLSAALYLAYHDMDTITSNSTNPWWLGIFLGVSAFNNCGLSLIDDGMVGHQFVSLIGSDSVSLMILAGNVGYPILLRLFLWLGRIAFPNDDKYHRWNDTFQFMLNYPRRVYTNIFPSAHTWWLLSAIIILTGIDWLAFSAFNLSNPSITSIPVGFRNVVAFFQSISIRSAGFSLVPVPQLSASTQAITVAMMYISAYPVLITIRSSNVYEESSLGIYSRDLKRGGLEKACRSDLDKRLGNKLRTRLFFLRQQLQHQLAHDLWWLTLSAIIIICIEADNYDRDPATYSIFNITFEVVSAYAPVGLSTGLPDEAYSLSGGVHTSSKLLLCAVMIRGRHRGLPVAIDKAVLLPGERFDNREVGAFWVHDALDPEGHNEVARV